MHTKNFFSNIYQCGFYVNRQPLNQMHHCEQCELYKTINFENNCLTFLCLYQLFINAKLRKKPFRQLLHNLLGGL